MSNFRRSFYRNYCQTCLAIAAPATIMLVAGMFLRSNPLSMFDWLLSLADSLQPASAPNFSLAFFLHRVLYFLTIGSCLAFVIFYFVTHRFTWSMMAATYLLARGQVGKSIEQFQSALDRLDRLGGHARQRAWVIAGLGEALRRAGRHDEAEAHLRNGLELTQDLYGPDHRRLQIPLINLANFHLDKCEYDQAEELLQRARHIHERSPQHRLRERAILLNNLGIVQEYRGHYAQAEATFREALELLDRVRSRAAIEATIEHNIGGVLLLQGRLEEAEEYLQASIPVMRKLAAHRDPTPWLMTFSLAGCQRRRSDLVTARATCQEALEMLEMLVGPEHSGIADGLLILAAIDRAEGNIASAEARYRRALAIREQAGLQDIAPLADDLSEFADLLKCTGREAEAAAMLARADACLRGSK